MSKLIPIDIQDLFEISDIMDRCHSVFKECTARDNKPTLSGREIYIPFNWIENKAEKFWHSASMKVTSPFDIFPCINDVSKAKCNDNCITKNDIILLSDNSERIKCIYRAIRIEWSMKTVSLYNAHDPRVKYWEKLNSSKRNRIYLRYQEEELDYLVVFEDKSEKRVVFITGFPIFYVSKKKDCDREYKNYITQLT